MLIPAYNAERFVDASITSVLQQTHQDLEIIAVDDASRDGTWNRLTDWNQRDPRVQVFRNEKNLGMTGNWVRCLSEARRDYVLKLDADDVLRPRTLEILLQAFDTPGVLAAGVRTLLCAEDLEPIDGLPADDAMMRAGIDPYADRIAPCREWLDLAVRGNQLWHSCAFMLPRQTLLDLGGYDVRFGCASDTELILRLLDREGLMAHRAYVGVLYRTVAGSVSAQFRANDWLQWEGIAANCMGMMRWRQRAPLPRSLRNWYVEYTERWRQFQASPEYTSKLPEPMRLRLEDVMAQLPPPPFKDRSEWQVRRLARRLLGLGA